MKQLIQKLSEYENRTPEFIFEWNDNKSNAKGWLVIDSLRNGAAGGGTRMEIGLNKQKVVSLAKVMGMKFSMSAMQIGGAKTGINFNPKDHRKKEILQRWYRAITPLLKSYYGTGGDLNVDELCEVIPITRGLGILHPQEGVLRGYFGNISAKENLKKRLRQLQVGVSKVIKDKNYSPDIAKNYTIAGMITGYGIAESVKHYYQTYGGEFLNKKVLLQGYGNVGSSAAYYLAKLGCKIVGIIESQCALVKSEGFTIDELKLLTANKHNIASPKIGHLISLDQIWKTEVNIFIPAATSRLIKREHVDFMHANGLELVSPGANIPFDDKNIFYGITCQYSDKKISLLPDFISNCGTAEMFRYFMEKETRITDEAIFKNISDTISNFIKKAYKENKAKINITKTFLQIALAKLLH